MNPIVTARPIKTARIANAAAAVALVVFVVTAIVMPYANAGASFGIEDQVFTAVIGLIIAGGLRLPTRPRLRADRDSVQLRSYLGNYRTVPWAAVTGVEFPRTTRFARLVLPGDESFAIYAVQRADGDYAVRTMQELRALFATTRPNVA